MELRISISDAFSNLLENRSRWLVLYGGAGSGKSVFAAQKLIYRIVSEPNHFIIITRKVAKTCRTSVFKLMKDQINAAGMGHLWRFHDTEMKGTYTPNGSCFMCLGMDDSEKIKSIANVTGFWHEEATELSEMDVKQLDLRLRGETKSYKQHIVSFNPISSLHWIRAYFWDNRPASCTVHKSTYKDNVFIDPEYKEVLENYIDQDYNYYRVYALGEWGELEGLIYDPWPVIEESEYPKLDTVDEIIYGLDFGFNNPSALVRIDIQDLNYYLREIMYMSNVTTDDIAITMTEWKVDPSDYIYADAAEPDRIEELYRKGFNVMPADKGPGSVAAGINNVKQKRLFSCPGNININKEVSGYKWREDRMGRILDEPAKLNDHAMDAIRYALHTHGEGQFFFK